MVIWLSHTLLSYKVGVFRFRSAGSRAASAALNRAVLIGDTYNDVRLVSLCANLPSMGWLGPAGNVTGYNLNRYEKYAKQCVYMFVLMTRLGSVLIFGMFGAAQNLAYFARLQSRRFFFLVSVTTQRLRLRVCSCYISAFSVDLVTHLVYVFALVTNLGPVLICDTSVQCCSSVCSVLPKISHSLLAYRVGVSFFWSRLLSFPKSH